LKNWVLPFLRSIKPETVSDEVYEQELARPVFCWRHLSNIFLHKFNNDHMDELLGAVISEMHKSDFDKLLKAYPFFVLLRSPGMVQLFHASGDVHLVMFCLSDLSAMGWFKAKALVAHEIAHVVLDHCSQPFSLDDPWLEKKQKEADELCCQWGFTEEIQAVRA